LPFKKLILMIVSNRMGFMVAPPGQYAYQNAYWLPDAVQAQEVIFVEHRAEARVQREQQQAIA
jgi:hypothetical protein